VYKNGINFTVLKCHKAYIIVYISLDFRLDFEFVARGIFFHKGRMKVTVSKLFKVCDDNLSPKTSYTRVCLPMLM